MSHIALKNILSTAALASPEQFENWQKAWRVAVTNGSQGSLLEVVSRERGTSEQALLQQFAGVLCWPLLGLCQLTGPTEARTQNASKLAFPYPQLPHYFHK